MGKAQTSFDQDQANLKHCHRCNSELPPQARFCSACGAIAEGVDTEPEIQEPQAAAEEQVQQDSAAAAQEEEEQASAAPKAIEPANEETVPTEATAEEGVHKESEVAQEKESVAGDEEEQEEEKTHTPPHLSAVIGSIGKREEPAGDTTVPVTREKTSASRKPAGRNKHGIEQYDTMPLHSYTPVPRSTIHDALTQRTVAVQSPPAKEQAELAEELDMGQTQRIPPIGFVGKRTATVPIEQRETQHIAVPKKPERAIPERIQPPAGTQAIWPVVLMVATIVTAFLVYVVPGLPVRPYIVLAYLLICPGMALIRLLRLHELAIEWTLAIALSIVFSAIIPTIQLYAHLWAPSVSLAILLVITFFGALAQLFAPRMVKSFRRLELNGNR